MMRRPLRTLHWGAPVLALAALAAVVSRPARADEEEKKKPEFPPHAQVLEGFEKVVSTVDGKSLYTLWTRKKDGQMYAELPGDYSSHKYFIALTIASGDRYAGLQQGDLYVYWRRYDKKLALMEPSIGIRSTGDKESKSSINRLFTDRVLMEVPIVTMGPGGGPVIDMDHLLVGNAGSFFGPGVFMSRFSSYGSSQRPTVFSIKTAKAFPHNVEIGFEVPTAGGRLQVLHYSISEMPDSTGYQPRAADERVGYFTTSYTDLGKYDEKETRTRYINRWHLEKADPRLKVSPPKEPIVFYIEHTTPIRYRRWVKEGILYWNKAFEKVGISDAIVVHYQDANPEYMRHDPEDVRYNFVRWLNNDQGTAIGPSRVHPLTGQILDADIILTDGWIRHFRQQFSEVMPQLAMEGFSAETLAWLGHHPDWDPRVLFAPPARRDQVRRELATQAAQPFGGHDLAQVDAALIGDDRFDGLVGRTSQVNGMCLAAQGMAFDVAFARMMFNLQALNAADDEEGKESDKKDSDTKEGEKKDKDLLDGMPEEFIGPLLANLVAHEVGHTLGLRHNFKATGIYSLQEINSDAIKGKKPLAGSVMDYIPINMVLTGKKEQPGDYTMIGIGPYDMWAIEYGYTFDKDLDPILARVKEPQLQYATDEDTGGPDPLARRYDFSKNPLDYAQEQMKLAQHQREQLIEKFVKKGESWANARRGYELTLMMQTRSVAMMASWLGGAFVNRARKGDVEGRPPVEVVPCETQRAALKFVIENTFRDEAYNLTPELVNRMTVDKWLDSEEDYYRALSEEPTWPVHDRIMGMQASVLTMLMQPTTLRRVYDNELRVPADQDMITLPELLSALSTEIWRELDAAPEKPATARKPLISSLRRNLQDEHLKRLVDLCMPGSGSTAAYKPIADLAAMQLRKIQGRIEKLTKEQADKLDPYTASHLAQSQDLIRKALDAQYIYNANALGRSSMPFIIFGNDGQPQGGK